MLPRAPSSLLLEAALSSVRGRRRIGPPRPAPPRPAPPRLASLRESAHAPGSVRRRRYAALLPPSHDLTDPARHRVSHATGPPCTPGLPCRPCRRLGGRYGGTAQLLSPGTPWGRARHRWAYIKFWPTLATITDSCPGTSPPCRTYGPEPRFGTSGAPMPAPPATFVLPSRLPPADHNITAAPGPGHLGKVPNERVSTPCTRGRDIEDDRCTANATSIVLSHVLSQVIAGSAVC